MVVRGVYSEAEQKMLADWKDLSEKLVGWMGEKPSNDIPYPVFHRVATKELILHMAGAADYWNPLWRDENYARNTRWGGIIAPPFFEQCIAHGGPRFLLKVPPEVGIVRTDMSGHYFQFFHPIKINDSFKVWIGSPKIEDITRDIEGAPRQFNLVPEVKYINQRDEVVSIFNLMHIVTIWPSGTKKDQLVYNFTKESTYTPEDIAAIDRIAGAEVIRGARPRYWEDVQIGEELTPIVQGPLTVWDEVVEIQGFGLAVMPVREIRRQTPERMLIDPSTGIPHKSIEFHLSEGTARAVGSYSTTLIAVTVEHFLARIVTNWMGDDAFIKVFNYLKFANTPLGDTIFGRGSVIKKYINDKGEYLVDIDVWMESNRGYIPNIATVTVSLLSKETTVSGRY
jgi:hypothetical protein